MALTQVDQGLLSTNAQYTGFKNRIINGAMVIDQRNAGASISAGDGAYAVDRFIMYHNTGSGSKGTIQQTPSATETGYATRVSAGFTNYYAFTTTSAYSVASTDAYAVQQRIEGFNIADLAWGTANAKTVTLSAWVYSSLTGTFGGSLRNSAATQSYPFSYSIPVANTWTQISITIVGSQSGTWLTTNGAGVYVSFSIGSGTSVSGTAGAWAGAGYYSATGAVSVVGTNSATFYITGVQLEKGSTATSFDYRPYGTELALCQRYYENNYSTGYAVGSAASYPYNIGAFVNGYTSSSGQKFQPWWLMVQKRTAQPTNTYYDTAGNSGKISSLDSGGTQTTNVSPGVTWVSDKYLGAGPSTGTMTGFQYFWTCSAEL
jgi:hypothetical protein